MIDKNLGYNIEKAKSSVIFRDNIDVPIHRWFHYAEGFSNEFVNDCFSKYGIEEGDSVFEPFVGSGTVPLCAKMLNINSFGIELNPLMRFIANVKNNFQTYDIEKVRKLKNSMILNNEKKMLPPEFLKNDKHFSTEILDEILDIKTSIWNLENIHEKDILKLAFASILLDVSNAKRVPSFGYKGKKNIEIGMAYEKFNTNLNKIISDIEKFSSLKLGKAKIKLGDARNKYFSDNLADIAITSPPYANGIDYVTDYQLEMGWLDLIDKPQKSELRNSMITYDKTKSSILREFYENGEFYREENLINVVHELEKISKDYWKKDIHIVILKYFDDMKKVFQNTYDILKPGARFILVVGDSLFKNVYVPADLLLAKLGENTGFVVEKIELARDRYSGQNRSYKLRETILTLRKA
ncbi:hypothetical protein JJB67_12335 [Clostridium perfringens]|uniref:hypothetical protein n=1 Tax=Clostridium perfringens TaxID=1502 RepID=UPI001ABA6D30|nr:hypothetical protein [Clostridium perfringens]MBO3323110.1 hypothetical protein [Clostridium perfringens]MBO3332274.1 hypothetical protein [Clostridium perfringens]